MKESEEMTMKRTLFTMGAVSLFLTAAIILSGCGTTIDFGIEFVIG